jgi:hypothetical protein
VKKQIKRLEVAIEIKDYPFLLKELGLGVVVQKLFDADLDVSNLRGLEILNSLIVKLYSDAVVKALEAPQNLELSEIFYDETTPVIIFSFS